MERKEPRSRADRREVQSVYMTVPTIVLNASPSEKGDNCALSHSRSAGELDNIASTGELTPSSKQDGLSKFSSSMADDIHDIDTRKNIGLYCSPRMPRRSPNSGSTNAVNRQSGSGLDTLNACSLNCLDPGSRVGSTVSLNSEYTTRSVGLISNDSSSECSQHLHGLMDSSYQKHSVLKRFYSSPEKDDDLLQHASNVRRNSKSMGNMQGEADACVCFEFGSDSTDDNFQAMETLPCDSDNVPNKNMITGDSEPPTEQNLVTMVTGGASLREGRIRKWLTEINGPDENANS